MLRASQAQPYALRRASSASRRRCVALRSLLQRVALSPASTVLLTGESGTGKDLAAKVLHFNSDRANRPVHEHHLLGDARRAARKRAVRPRARRVHRRTPAEARPARVGRRRHGVPRRDRRDGRRRCRRSCCGSSRRRPSSASAASHDIRVDVRVIAATNRNLEEQVKAGKFREDLFYRLNVLPIALPPLRAHLERHPAPRRLLRGPVQPRVPQARPRRVAGGADGAAASTAGRATSAKLRNAVERAMLLAEGEWLEPQDFPVLTTSAGSQRRHRACRPTASTSRTLERSLVDAGARALRRQPDARRRSCSGSTAIRSATGSRSST